MDLQLNWTTCFAVAGYVVANPAVRQALAWGGRAALTVSWKRVVVPASVVLIALLVLAESPVMAQSRRGVRQTTNPAANANPGLGLAIASFTGTLKTITKKDVTVDLDSGNTVDFKLSKKTEFYVGEKKVTAKELAPEAAIKIEGNKDAFGVLTATRITVKQETP